MSKNKHPLYGVWYHIIYKYYRVSNGIFKLREESSARVCERWLSSIEEFAKDVGNRPSPKHFFRRIDKEKDYSPENCKWATRYIKEKTKIPSHILTSNKLAKEVGLSRERVRQIVYSALAKKDAEFINLCENIKYTDKYIKVLFKPEAIEYFKNKKYYFKDNVKDRRLETLIKLNYLEGNDINFVSDMLMKPARIIERYYKKFDEEKNGTN